MSGLGWTWKDKGYSVDIYHFRKCIENKDLFLEIMNLKEALCTRELIKSKLL